MSSEEDQRKQAVKNLIALSEDNGGAGYEYDVLINDETDIDRMGSCTIRVSKYNDTTIVITATAKFGSEEEQVAAYVQTEVPNKHNSFSNAIEICLDKGGTFNNLHVLGDMATITGNDKTQTYYISNETSVDGALQIYGNVKGSANPGVHFGPGLTSNSVGGCVKIWGNMYLDNGWKAITDINKADTNQDNFIMVMGTIKLASSGFLIGNIPAGNISNPKDFGLELDTEPKSKRTNKGEVDVYCHQFIGSNTFKCLGNMVITGESTNYGSSYALDLTNCDGGEIYGDLLVNGTISNTHNGKLKVHGNVYCTTDIPDCIEVLGPASGDEKNKREKVTALPTSNRYAVPQFETTLNEYQYYPEDLIANPDSNIGKLKSQYDALHTGSEKRMIDVYNKNLTNGYSYSGSGTTVSQSAGSSVVKVTSDGTTSEYFGVIDESCVYVDEWTQANGDGTTPVKTLSGNSGEHKNGKLLVHVTNKDIIILLRTGAGSGEGTKSFADAPTIVVKNDSPDTNPHFCYFITDAGKNVGYKTEADRKNNQKNDFGLFKAKIIDYDLYSKMYSSEVLLDENWSLPKEETKASDPSPRYTQVYNSSFALNMTDSEIAGATKLPDERIFYLFTYGSGFYAGQESFHEGIIYGPEGIYNCETQAGIQFPNVYTTPETCKTSVPIMSLGMVITGNFYNKNDSFYGFNEPDPASAFQVVKGAYNKDFPGYHLIRYEHH